MGCLAMPSNPLDLHRRRGPSTSSALRPGERPRRRMGAVCENGDAAGGVANGAEAARPLSLEKAAAPSGADARVAVLPSIPSFPIRLRRAAPALSTCHRISPRQTATRSCSRPRALLLASPRLQRPARVVAGDSREAAARCSLGMLPTSSGHPQDPRTGSRLASPGPRGVEA
jgi:hypothetical protein